MLDLYLLTRAWYWPSDLHGLNHGLSHLSHNRKIGISREQCGLYLVNKTVNPGLL